MSFRRDQGPRGGAEHLARIHGTEEDKVNRLSGYMQQNSFFILIVHR